MAMNPMQRRARNSFLIGFLVALIIMSLIVLGLVYKIKSINEAKELLEQKQIKVYVAATDLESGAVVKLDEDFTMSTVQTTVPKDEIISEEDFQFTNSNGDIVVKYNDDGSEKEKEVVMKVNVPAGTIVTKDMIVESGEETTASQRILEYNMISLPSRLKNGEYVDVRMTIPNGQDYIILSKKRVLGCDTTTIWLQLDELEIDLLNSAIVDSYTYTGSKIYAAPYVEAGMQENSTVTYTVRREVLALINSNPNIIDEAKANYNNKYDSVSRVDNFEQVLSLMPSEDKQTLVNTGIGDELEAIKSAREEYVSQLEGTDSVGYKNNE